MLKKPVAVIILLATVIIAAFVGVYYASRVQVPVSPDFPTLEDAGAKPGDGASAATGAGTGRPPGARSQRPAASAGAPGPSAAAGATTQPAPGIPNAGSATPPNSAAGGPAPPPPARPRELTIPIGTIIVIQLITPLSSEVNRVEDPVEAQLSKDVTVGAHVAVPAGTKVKGSVTVADKGGGNKPARVGVRFHSLVLAGSEPELLIDPVIKEVEAPAGEGKKKMGMGAMVGGAIGYFTGGIEGAIKGGAAGAAGGAAVAATKKPGAAEVSRGASVSVILRAPVTIVFDQ